MLQIISLVLIHARPSFPWIVSTNKFPSLRAPSCCWSWDLNFFTVSLVTWSACLTQRGHCCDPCPTSCLLQFLFPLVFLLCSLHFSSFVVTILTFFTLVSSVRTFIWLDVISLERQTSLDSCSVRSVSTRSTLTPQILSRPRESCSERALRGNFVSFVVIKVKSFAYFYRFFSRDQKKSGTLYLLRRFSTEELETLEPVPRLPLSWSSMGLKLRLHSWRHWRVTTTEYSSQYFL